MRIKEVCEKTGLTDKAVRTYIKEELISPNYDENYMGRRAFNFNDEDVQQLRKIVILRKYNFSLKEIKALFAEDVTANELLASHIDQMKSDINADIDIINSMVNASSESPSNIDELCDVLDTPEIVNKPIPVVDNNSFLKNEYKRKVKQNNALVIILLIILGLTMILGFVVFIVCDALRPVNSSVNETKFLGICIVNDMNTIVPYNDNTNIDEYTDALLLISVKDNKVSFKDVNNKFDNIDVSLTKKNTIKIKATYITDKSSFSVMPIIINDKGKRVPDLLDSQTWVRKENNDYDYLVYTCYNAEYAYSYDISIVYKE